jgi:hypothetical protein
MYNVHFSNHFFFKTRLVSRTATFGGSHFWGSMVSIYFTSENWENKELCGNTRAERFQTISDFPNSPEYWYNYLSHTAWCLYQVDNMGNKNNISLWYRFLSRTKHSRWLTQSFDIGSNFISSSPGLNFCRQSLIM